MHRFIHALCFSGQATGVLRPFRRAYGVEPSETMLAGARKNIESQAFPISSAFAAARDPPTAFEFVQSPAERLPFLKDKSVDLLISGAPHDSQCLRETEKS